MTSIRFCSGEVADGVADDVFHSAVQQFAVAGDDDLFVVALNDAAVADFGFDGAILGHHAHEFADVDGLEVAGAGVAFGAGDLKKARRRER